MGITTQQLDKIKEDTKNMKGEEMVDYFEKRGIKRTVGTIYRWRRIWGLKCIGKLKRKSLEDEIVEKMGILKITPEEWANLSKEKRKEIYPRLSDESKGEIYQHIQQKEKGKM